MRLKEGAKGPVNGVQETILFISGKLWAFQTENPIVLGQKK